MPVRQLAADEGDGAKAAQEPQACRHKNGPAQLHTLPPGCHAVSHLMHPCTTPSVRTPVLPLVSKVHYLLYTSLPQVNPGDWRCI